MYRYLQVSNIIIKFYFIYLIVSLETCFILCSINKLNFLTNYHQLLNLKPDFINYTVFYVFVLQFHQ